jgi:hypothetical protein
MENTDLSVEEIIVPQIAPKKNYNNKGKDYLPMRESKRIKEDGTYNLKPLDPEYFKKYYHAHKVSIQCECCDKYVDKYKLNKHKRSKYCTKITELKKSLNILSI